MNSDSESVSFLGIYWKHRKTVQNFPKNSCIEDFKGKPHVSESDAIGKPALMYFQEHVVEHGSWSESLCHCCLRIIIQLSDGSFWSTNDSTGKYKKKYAT